MPGVRLSLDDRCEIEQVCRSGGPLVVAAKRLGRPASTVGREVERSGGRACYRASVADRRAQERARRPRPLKLVARPELAAVVSDGLKKCWSPQQIAGRLRVEHPHDPHWWVSHETIYKSLYLQGRGGLRAELIEALRSGRARRRPRRRISPDGRGKIPDMVLISQRPPEVEDRAVPGHWEGDLLIGTREGNSHVATLVERTSRFLQIVPLPTDRKAETVRQAIARKITQLPDQLARSLTWDRGKEMSEHALFTVDTGIAIYFCDPYAPWQRGTSENTNRLLRQYLPRGADYSLLDETDLDAIAHELNNRPRKTLGYRTPAEVFNDHLIAMTT